MRSPFLLMIGLDSSWLPRLSQRPFKPMQPSLLRAEETGLGLAGDGIAGEERKGSPAWR